MENENLIFGLRPIIEAIKSGKTIEKLFIQVGLKGDIYAELHTLIKEKKINYQLVPLEKLSKLTFRNHQGVVAYIAPIIYDSLDNVLMQVFETGKNPLLLILDRITDVRNFGAIVRTAECAGVDAIIVPVKGAALINADAIKTSAGAIHKMPICKEQYLPSTIEFLKESGLQIIACTEKGKEYYSKVDYTLPTAIIMGSEEDGISRDLLKLTDQAVKIPILGEIESLNVSVAAGVIMYEAIRQREL